MTPRPAAGFTLVELVAVLVLTAVLGAAALGRWQGPETRLGYQADQLARDLRHAQFLAMAWERPLRFAPVPGGYRVACVTAGPAPCDASPVQDPATGQPFQVLLADATLAGPVVDFDTLGRPTAAGGGLLGGSQTWTLSAGAGSAAVTLAPLTGFATVTY